MQAKIDQLQADNTQCAPSAPPSPPPPSPPPPEDKCGGLTDTGKCKIKDCEKNEKKLNKCKKQCKKNKLEKKCKKTCCETGPKTFESSVCDPKLIGTCGSTSNPPSGLKCECGAFAAPCLCQRK